MASTEEGDDLKDFGGRLEDEGLATSAKDGNLSESWDVVGGADLGGLFVEREARAVMVNEVRGKYFAHNLLQEDLFSAIQRIT